jgi:hypothetical protein
MEVRMIRMGRRGGPTRSSEGGGRGARGPRRRGVMHHHTTTSILALQKSCGKVLARNKRPIARA